MVVVEGLCQTRSRPSQLLVREGNRICVMVCRHDHQRYLYSQLSSASHCVPHADAHSNDLRFVSTNKNWIRHSQGLSVANVLSKYRRSQVGEENSQLYLNRNRCHRNNSHLSAMILLLIVLCYQLNVYYYVLFLVKWSWHFDPVGAIDLFRLVS